MSKTVISMMGALLILFAVSLAFGEESKDVISVQKNWYDRIDMGINASTVFQGAINAGVNGVDKTTRYELELKYNLAKDGVAYFHLEAGHGKGIDNRVTTLSSLNDDAVVVNDGNVSVSEAWYLQKFPWVGMMFEVGEVELGGTGDCSPKDAILFDQNEYANNERSQFLSSDFVNNLSLTFPKNGLGAMIRISPLESLDISAGIADADGKWTDVFSNIWSIGELNFKPEIGEHPGHYRIYGWFKGKGSDLTVTNYGFGLSFDQEILDILGMFARYGWQQQGTVQQAWSIGLQLSGKFYDRDNDTSGLACGMPIGVNPEHDAEFYYNWSVNDYLNLSPNIQWVMDPKNGNEALRNIVIFGLRTQISF